MSPAARLLRTMQQHSPDSDAYVHAQVAFALIVTAEQPSRFARGIWRCTRCRILFHGSALAGSPDNGWCPDCHGSVIPSCTASGDLVVGL